MKLKALLSLVCFTFLFSCSKNNINDSDTIGDTLSSEDADFLDTIVIPLPHINEMLDVDGKPIRSGPNDGSKKALINNMLLETQKLSTARSGVDHPSEGSDKSAH